MNNGVGIVPAPLFITGYGSSHCIYRGVCMGFRLKLPGGAAFGR